MVLSISGLWCWCNCHACLFLTKGNCLFSLLAFVCYSIIIHHINLLLPFGSLASIGVLFWYTSFCSLIEFPLSPHVWLIFIYKLAVVKITWSSFPRFPELRTLLCIAVYMGMWTIGVNETIFMDLISDLIHMNFTGVHVSFKHRYTCRSSAVNLACILL